MPTYMLFTDEVRIKGKKDKRVFVEEMDSKPGQNLHVWKAGGWGEGTKGGETHTVKEAQ